MLSSSNNVELDKIGVIQLKSIATYGNGSGFFWFRSVGNAAKGVYGQKADLLLPGYTTVESKYNMQNDPDRTCMFGAGSNELEIRDLRFNSAEECYQALKEQIIAYRLNK